MTESIILKNCNNKMNKRINYTTILKIGVQYKYKRFIKF